MKPLMKHLHRKKGQKRALLSLLWMRYKVVEQSMLSFADVRLLLYVPKGRYPLAGRGQVLLP